MAEPDFSSMKPLVTYTTYDGVEYSILARPVSPHSPIVTRWRVPPNAAMPAPHVHPQTVHSYSVLAGRLDVLIGNTWRTLQAGESARAQPGVRHTFRNSSGADAVVLNVHEPHRNLEAFIRSTASLTRNVHSSNPRSPATAIGMALLLERYPALIKPTAPATRVVVEALSRLRRLADAPL